MKIIIAGAGEVGYHLASMLADEEQDIYLVDRNEDRLNYIQSKIDVFTIRGDAKSISVLQEAKVKDCDLLIAVTSNEETNFLICVLGKKLGAKRTIARFTNSEIIDFGKKQIFEEIGIDEVISPVELASKEIIRLVRQSAFTDDFEFEGGKLSVFGITLDEHSLIVNKSIKDSAYLNPNLNFKPIAVLRGDQTMIPKGDTVLLNRDIVYFISVKESINQVLNICGKQCFPIRNIMILGGSKIGVLTAQMLQHNFNVVLIERDKAASRMLAEQLKKTLVVNADGRDVVSLEEEGIENMDAFIAVTPDSEMNIMSCLVAKSFGVKKTIAGVENINYINLSHNIGIDTLINKKIIAASNIFRYIRKGQVSAIANLHGVDAEIIEFVVAPGSRVTTKAIRDLDFPKEAHIAAVVRGEDTYIPLGDFEIQGGDKVIVFSLTEAIHRTEKYFQ
jgi:trk system potassium uptake protein